MLRQERTDPLHAPRQSMEGIPGIESGPPDRQTGDGGALDQAGQRRFTAKADGDESLAGEAN
jgi:hypothetical protein